MLVYASKTFWKQKDGTNEQPSLCWMKEINANALIYSKSEASKCLPLHYLNPPVFSHGFHSVCWCCGCMGCPMCYDARDGGEGPSLFRGNLQRGLRTALNEGEESTWMKLDRLGPWTSGVNGPYYPQVYTNERKRAPLEYASSFIPGGQSGQECSWQTSL